TASGHASVQVQAGAESFDVSALTASPRNVTAAGGSVFGGAFIDRSALNASIQLQAQPDSGSFAFQSGAQIFVALPEHTFSATGSGALSVGARLANGRPLPAWLRFDPVTGTFTGQAPPGFVGELKIKISVRDSRGNTASSMMEINIGMPRSTDAFAN